jgi:hypothetical protein
MTISKIARRSVFVLLALLAACAAPPPFGVAGGSIPPVPPGAARIFFYRWLEPYETLQPTTAFLNGRAVGVASQGAVFYRDVVPGPTTIAVDSRGVFINQFKTVAIRPGDVVYARIESLDAWGACDQTRTGCWPTFVVAIVQPAKALAEIRDLPLVPG